MQVKTFCILQVAFFSLKFDEIIFVSSLYVLYNFITCNHWIIHNTCLIFSIFTITCSRIPNIILSAFRTFLHSYQYLPFFHHWFESHFFPSNLHLHLHDMPFAKIFESYIPVITLNMLELKSSFLFGTHTLLDKSLRVLQLPQLTRQIHI